MPLVGPPLDEPVDLVGLLDVGLNHQPDDTALVSALGQWSWRELADAADRYAANLLGLGLRPGDRVASLMPNRNALLLHYLGCARAGLVMTPLNYRYMPPEIDHALGVSEASILLHHAERDEDVAESRLAAKLPLGTIRYGADDPHGQSFMRLVDREPKDPALPRPAPSDPAAIFFTSGSTGKPKGVTHTHETLGWIIASIRAAFGLTRNDVLLPGSSCSHIGGFVFSHAALSAGAKVVMARTYDGHEVLPLLREHRPTVLCMLPAALMHLIRDHGARRDDFVSLRLCRAGGDKVSAELEKEFTELTGFPIDEGYGMSEIGLAALNPPQGPFHLGSVGQPIYGYVMSIRDDQGNEVAVGEDGRLWVSAPSVTVGYWNRPDATAETIVDGWLDTGDVMRADAKGFLWFRGRKKQIIVHDGSNICPQEVEEALLEHDAVESAGVVGVHDLVHGENVRAYITLRADATPPNSSELILFTRERIGYKAPEQVIVLEAMPLNATGKVDRMTLKKLAEDDHHRHEVASTDTAG